MKFYMLIKDQKTTVVEVVVEKFFFPLAALGPTKYKHTKETHHAALVQPKSQQHHSLLHV